jgi:hypothetical protein
MLGEMGWHELTSNEVRRMVLRSSFRMMTKRIEARSDNYL